ncbi:uncharacterized protein DDB_G0288805-like [Lucilia cuprina]|uniref:uncharacterized protein DDB_G0288805-like n=1 Tax=Lucilia cuprina TaxID=7375 RepID=UPI001F05D8BB|nr:uncharacterized protein DDB_G0288805-like [Lucilia cuprina]
MDNNAVQSISTTTTVADDSDNDEVTDFLNSNSSPNALTPLSTIATTITTTTTFSTTTTNTNTTTETSTLNTTITSFNNLVENSKANLNNINCTNTVESQNYCIPVINTPPPNNNQQHSIQSRQSALTSSSLSSSNNNNNNNNTFNSQHLLANKNDNNMIPIINVTPHSPVNVSKYNNIFEDTLSQLQNIRESVVQMKNSSTHMNDSLSNYGLVNATILSASLPDLSATGNGGGGSSGIGPYGPLAAHFVMWSPQQQQQYLLNADRRKSWTGIDDLTAGGDCTNKSVSLSSLDSEEQETIRVTEQRRRSARNSTGGKLMFY